MKNGWTCNECEFYEPWNGVCRKTRSEMDVMDVCENFEMCELLKTRGEK